MKYKGTQIKFINLVKEKMRDIMSREPSMIHTGVADVVGAS